MQKYENSVIGEWLTNQNWSHWATLTTGYELTLNSARRAAHRFHDVLDRSAPTKIFWAAEPYDLKDGFHLHALLDVPKHLEFKNIVDIWQKVSKGGKGKWNRIDLQTYDSNKGAGYYLSKYITKRLSDYDLLTTGASRNYCFNKRY
jgi:hypothetical protein